MKYLLFEKSAVELMINHPELQSLEYSTGKAFIRYLCDQRDEFSLRGIVVKQTNHGILFVGEKVQKTFLVIDTEKCLIFQQKSDAELLMAMQKLFRFCIRYWEDMPFVACEKTFQNKSAIFPFSFSAGIAEHIVVIRNPDVSRLAKRNMDKCVLAYDFTNQTTINLAQAPEPDYGNYTNAGNSFWNAYHEIRQQFEDQKNIEVETTQSPINVIENSSIVQQDGFKYFPYEKQIERLTEPQRKVVMSENVNSPIRVEGPAGTGKTVSLILRAIYMLKKAESTGEPIRMIFLTHSDSTEEVVRQQLIQLGANKWIDSEQPRSIRVQTLLSWCAEYIHIEPTQLVDHDANEAKQNQLELIREAFEQVKKVQYDTYKNMISDRFLRYLSEENIVQISVMLQHEFSTRIKGIAGQDWERYKMMKPIENGIPGENEYDKEFIYKVFMKYQDYLETLNVYDTDDVSLEALTRLDAPLWRRKRVQEGFQYLFVDEMHLFNLNEQQLFHYLTDDVTQKTIPICFALDYSQAIGERGDHSDNYFEKELIGKKVERLEYSTVFRCSPMITELCASITASGAMLFQNFVNPYVEYQSGFTAKEEALCDVPKLLQYSGDREMMDSIGEHVRRLVNKYKCQPNEIGVIFLDESLINLWGDISQLGGYDINWLLSRNTGEAGDRRKVVVTTPDYINGLEFKAVILPGIDQGRVPSEGIVDISKNFLRYSALNKLYLACSRAQYSVLMLNSGTHRISDCLSHAIENERIKIEKL